MLKTLWTFQAKIFIISLNYITIYSLQLVHRNYVWKLTRNIWKYSSKQSSALSGPLVLIICRRVAKTSKLQYVHYVNDFIYLFLGMTNFLLILHAPLKPSSCLLYDNLFWRQAIKNCDQLFTVYVLKNT